MSKTFREWNPEQQWLLPLSVMDFVPEGHQAHFIRNLVREELDLSEIMSDYSKLRGYPPFHPVMMTALLLYAYTQGVYSSRRIARACVERVDFMAVTGVQKPDFRTICKFRKRHLKALKGLFLQILKLCSRAGLVKLGHVAIDGTKMKANASKSKAMSYKRMLETEQRLEQEIAGWFDEAERVDNDEDDQLGRDKRGDEMPDWVSNKTTRLAKIGEAKAALEAEAAAGHEKDSDPPKPKDKAQRNFTDPESRIMKGHDGFVQAYNCQAAVDADSHVIVAGHVTQNANDQKELKPLVRAIKTNTGRQTIELSADTGYCSEENLKTLNRHHIRGYVALGRQHHGEASPVGNKGVKPGTRLHAMRNRLRQGGYRSRYRLRKHTVEPVFGNIKEARKFTRFSLRGLQNVQGEWNLICIAHNLLKLFKATGPNRIPGRKSDSTINRKSIDQGIFLRFLKAVIIRHTQMSGVAVNWGTSC